MVRFNGEVTAEKSAREQTQDRETSIECCTTHLKESIKEGGVDDNYLWSYYVTHPLEG